MGSVIEGEDVVQDTFIRAFVAVDELEEMAPLRAWLFRILREGARPPIKQPQEPEVLRCPRSQASSVRQREPHLPFEVRTSVATSESDYARAHCGDLTRGDRIPGMALRQYAGRHDRHASDSTKVGVRRLEAR